MNVAVKELVKSYAPEPVLGVLAKRQLEQKAGGMKERQKLHALTQEKIKNLRSAPDYTGILEPNTFEYRLNSQNGEDGIIDLIFSLIGFKTRTFVELGFGATEANCLNIGILNKLQGMFVDQAPLTCRMARAMFTACRLNQFVVEERFVTRDNFEDLIDSHRLPEELDILSIDIDGNDYWLWEGLKRVRPRVIVIEYNDRLGPDDAVTISYDPAFHYGTLSHAFYVGASLQALSRLGQKKGYRLVAVDSAGVNAFFLLSEIQCDELATVDAKNGFRFNRRSIRKSISPDERRKIISSLPFERV